RARPRRAGREGDDNGGIQPAFCRCGADAGAVPRRGRAVGKINWLRGHKGNPMVATAPKRLIRHRVLCVPLAAFALPVFLALALPAPLAAWAACGGPVADRGARLWHAAAGSEEGVRLTFLGHASFLIESPQGVRIVTDYNGVIRAPATPDIVTMNNAHPTH